MKKTSIFLSLVMLSACASIPGVHKTSLNFDSAKNIFSAFSSQKQIVENFGEPYAKEKESTGERWRYLDPSTKFERLQFVFNESKMLVQLFWFPLPGEKELKIEQIFEQYPKDYFKITNKRRPSKHSLETDSTYSNGSSMSILRDDSRKEVQVVAWYTPQQNQEIHPNKSAELSR